MIKKLAVIILSLALVACVFCACDKSAKSNDGEDSTAAVSSTNDDGDKADKAEKKEKKEKKNKKDKKKKGEERSAADLGEGEIMLGSSCYSITLPERVEADEVSTDEANNMVVAKFYSLVNDLEFTVSQWTKAEEETLDSVIGDYASMYFAEPSSGTTENGVDIATFEAPTNREGIDYNMVVFLMQDGDQLIELDFWFNSDEGRADAESIMNSLRK